MVTVRKIFKSLSKNSNNEVVAKFLQDIFVEENQGLHQWNSKYDELIEEYYGSYIDED